MKHIVDYCHWAVRYFRDRLSGILSDVNEAMFKESQKRGTFISCESV